MNTDDLILQLARDTRPVRREAVTLRIAIGVGLGAIGSAVLVVFWMRLRTDFGAAMMSAWVAPPRSYQSAFAENGQAKSVSKPPQQASGRGGEKACFSRSQVEVDAPRERVKVIGYTLRPCH
jgi:hypothetical protein